MRITVRNIERQYNNHSKKRLKQILIVVFENLLAQLFHSSFA